MNRILAIIVACALALSVFLMGVSCTKGEKKPEKPEDGTTDVQKEDAQGDKKDPEDSKDEPGASDSTSAADTDEKNGADTEKEGSKDTSKADKDTTASSAKDPDDTTSDKGSKDTGKAPSGDKDTEKADKETGYMPAPMTYEEFISMSPADQQAYFEQFENIEDYMKWYNDALEAYEKEQNKQEIDGVIDIGELINGKN